MSVMAALDAVQGRKTCRTCAFWFANGDHASSRLPKGIERSECRANAPAPVLLLAVTELRRLDATWPVTKSHHWCGQYKRDARADVSKGGEDEQRSQ